MPVGAARTLKHDVIVIGGGTGGLRLALMFANAGLQTALVEPGHLGGTCLNTGCIPTKAMLEAAHRFRDALEAKEFGIIHSKPSIDFKALMERVREIIHEGRSHIRKTTNKRNLHLFKAHGSFIDGGTILAGKETLTADRIVISTGAKNLKIKVGGLDEIGYLTNETVVDLKKLPKSVIMIGGGYISIELASFFAMLGVKVTVLERLPHILEKIDHDVSEIVVQNLESLGVNIITDANLIAARRQFGRKQVWFNDVRDYKSEKRHADAEEVVMAVGRVPNTESLNAAVAGINLGKQQEIVINEFFQTSNPSIYSLGDVTGKAMFAHAVKRETKSVFENVTKGNNSRMYFDLMPWAVFSSPPIAGIGLSEKDAKAKNIEYGVMKSHFSNNGRARIIGNEDGFVKVLFERSTRRIIGCTIVGPGADDIIHEFVAVMNSSEPTIDVVQRTIHIHPTLSEVMEGLKEN